MYTCQQQTLDQVVLFNIQTNGIVYTVENYPSIRDEYYESKQSSEESNAS